MHSRPRNVFRYDINHREFVEKCDHGGGILDRSSRSLSVWPFAHRASFGSSVRACTATAPDHRQSPPLWKQGKSEPNPPPPRGGEGKEKRERIIVVVRSPCQENYPADAHPSALKSALESANPRMDSEGASGCTWSTARATAPSPGRPTPGVVQQDKSSGGSVDTTKTRSDPQRVRMSSGERPIGAAKGKQSDTEALCQPPPPPER